MYFKIIKLGEVTSTNDYAYKLARDGQKEVTCVVADNQTKGKGRLGRKWVSMPNKGVYVSFIFRPLVEFKKTNLLGIAVALSAVKALKDIIPLKIKWPNDIIAGNRKIGGVLLEAQAGVECPLFIVAGLGLNISFGVKDLPEGASSLFIETKKRYKTEKIFKRIVKEVIMLYGSFKKGNYSKIVDEASSYIDTLGKNVLVDMGGRKIKGTAYKIGEYGALCIKDDKGIIKKVLSSEIVHCR